MNVDPRGKPFPQLKNDCLLRAIRGDKIDYVPVWLMRQAGRHLPEYLELSKGNSFQERIDTPEIASKITIQPIDRYQVDAAIIFSDILVIPSALGVNVNFGKKIVISNKLTPEDWREKIRGKVKLSESLAPKYEAITMTRHNLNGKCPLIGFSGAPYTLMSYMITGNSADIPSPQTKIWFYNHPEDSKDLLSIISDKIIEHLVEQVKAGAQFLQIFESRCSDLTPQLFEQFVYPCIKRICISVKQELKALGADYVPIGVFLNGGFFGLHLLDQDDNGVDVILVNPTIKPEYARQIITNKCIQGNMDLMAMASSPEKIVELTAKMLEEFGTNKYIAGLGEAMTPIGKVDVVKAFVDAVHDISRNMILNK